MPNKIRDTATRSSELNGRAILGVILLTTFVGVYGTFIFGISSIDLTRLPWPSIHALYGFISLLSIMWLYAFIGFFYFKKSFLQVSFSLAVLMSIVFSAFLSMVSVLIFVIASICLGSLVLGSMTSTQSLPWEIRFLIGSGILGAFAFVTSFFPINTEGFFFLILLIPTLLGRANLKVYFRSICSAPSHNIDGSLLPNILKSAVVALGGAHYFTAFLPDLGHDSLAVHLFIASSVESWLLWDYDVANYLWAVTPMHADWIFAINFLLGGESASRIINFIYLVCVISLGFRMSRSFGVGVPGSLLAIGIVLTTPMAFLLTVTLFADLVWSAYVVGCVFVLLFLRHHLTFFVLTVVAATLLGFSFMTKIGTLPLGVFIFFIFSFMAVSKKSPHHIFTFVCVLFLVGGGPYVNAYLVTGNPVFPFFNGIFQSPLYPPVNFVNDFFRSPISFTTPYAMVFKSHNFVEGTVGAAGAQWLLLFPLALLASFGVRDYRIAVILMTSLLSVLVVFTGQTYLRYISPQFFLMSFAAMASGALLFDQGSSSRLRGLYTIFSSVGIVTVVLFNLLFFTSANWVYREFPVSILFDRKALNEYVEARQPLRLANEAVNFFNKADAPVAMLSQPFGYGLRGKPLYSNWYNMPFETDIREALDPASVSAALLEHGASLIILEAGWGSPEKRLMVRDASDLLQTIGPVEVRRLKTEYMRSEELLKSPTKFDNESWMTFGYPNYDTAQGELITNQDYPASQVVPVKLGGNYELSSVSKCYDAGASLRHQVAWFDLNGEQMAVESFIFECSDVWTTNLHEFTAPTNSSYATVYIVGAGSESAVVQSASFRLRLL